MLSRDSELGDGKEAATETLQRPYPVLLESFPKIPPLAGSIAARGRRVSGLREGMLVEYSMRSQEFLVTSYVSRLSVGPLQFPPSTGGRMRTPPPTRKSKFRRSWVTWGMSRPWRETFAFARTASTLPGGKKRTRHAPAGHGERCARRRRPPILPERTVDPLHGLHRNDQSGRRTPVR